MRVGLAHLALGGLGVHGALFGQAHAQARLQAQLLALVPGHPALRNTSECLSSRTQEPVLWITLTLIPTSLKVILQMTESPFAIDTITQKHAGSPSIQVMQ